MHKTLAALLLYICAVSAHADEAEFEGRWMLDVRIPAEPLAGVLELQSTGDGWAAFVEGGPAPVEINDSNIEVFIDARDRQGYLFQRKLIGSLKNGVMTGTMESIDVLESAAEYGENGSAWSGRRYTDDPPEQPITNISDLAGIWAPLRGVDFRKWTMALTPVAREWHAGYDARMDEPQKRCISPGLVAAVSWSFPVEIVASNGKLVILYEAFNLSRRVFTDDRDDPEFYPNSSMGYSTARLENGELVIHTKLLTQTTRDFNGEPVSENARTVERYRLSDDGNRLSLVFTLLDPDNYERPPVRRRVWTRQDDAVIFPFECDPDSFFRQLYNEGRMQEYIDRAPRRP